MEKQLAWIWLAEGLGYAAANSGEVFAEYPGGAEEMLQNIGSLSMSRALTERQAGRLASTSPADYAPLYQKTVEKGIEVVGYGSDDYPELLRTIFDPPAILYLRGDKALLHSGLNIAIVGSRRPSAYGVDAVRSIGKGLAEQGAVIVSGLASGLDAEAHKAALAADKPTIACIAFGHDKCYPAAHRDLMDIIARHGLVVSEYPLTTAGLRPHYIQRNRLIAGLSHGLLVAQARLHSGTSSTVDFAIDYGRDVFAVPGDIFAELSTGTHQMLREGAMLATCAEDILCVYRDGVPLPSAPSMKKERQPAGPLLPQTPKAKEQTPPPEIFPGSLGQEAKRVYACLTSSPKGLGQICEETQLSPGVVMAALTELELSGLSRQLAGRQFIVSS